MKDKFKQAIKLAQKFYRHLKKNFKLKDFDYGNYRDEEGVTWLDVWRSCVSMAMRGKIKTGFMGFGFSF